MPIEVGQASGGGATTLVIGSTVITGGTNTRILYDNNGVVGELNLSNSKIGSVGFTYPFLT